MKKWLIAMTGLCALVVACQKGVTTDPSRSIVIGGDNSGTPRLVPPVPDTPSNAQQLDTLRPTLTIRNGSSNQTGTRTYDFQVSTAADFAGLPNSGGLATSYVKTNVAEGSNGTTSLTVDQDLQSGTTFFWRARLVQGTTKSDWSDANTFKSKVLSFNRAGELFDTLSDGSTLGTPVGSTTFVAGKGIRINDQNSYVRYQLVQPISNGEFSVEIEGLSPSSFEGKLKLMSMLDGTGNLLNSKYLMNTQYRGTSGNPDNAISFKIVFGDNDFTLEPNFAQRRDGIRSLSASKTYLWKATWGSFFRLQIFDGTNSIYDLSISAPPGASYSPNPHYIYLGANNGLGEDAGSFPGAIYRNLSVKKTQ